MKRITTITGIFISMTTAALASGGSETAELGLLTIIFLVFGALIIVGQLIPGLLLLCSALKGLFARTVRH